MLAARAADPTGYGRVVRGRDDSVARVVEHGDATDAELDVHDRGVALHQHPGGALRAEDRRGHLLAVALAQDWLGVESIEVRRTAAHEYEDDVLCGGSEMRAFQGAGHLDWVAVAAGGACVVLRNDRG